MTDQSDPNDFLMSGGVPAAKFKTVGDYVKGVISRQPRLRQQTDPDGTLKFFKDGISKRMEMVIVVQIGKGEDDEDTGERSLYVHGNMQQVIREAVRVAGAQGVEIGGELFVRFIGLGAIPNPGMNAPKLYEAKYRPPSAQVQVPAEPAQQSVAAQASAGNGQPAPAAPATPASLPPIPF